MVKQEDQEPHARQTPTTGATQRDDSIIITTAKPSTPLSEKFALTNARGRILALAIMAIICCLVYTNSLRAPFVLDDKRNFIDNPYTQIKEISGKTLWDAASRSPRKSRWLPNVSFGLNYYFGEKDPIGYHLVNLAVHLLTGLLMYLLALKTLSLPDMSRYAKFRHEVSLAATALWLLHPVQTNAVTYLVQRMTSMSALFCLLSLLMYVSARTTVSGKRIFYFSATIIGGFFAFVSKENSYMLPALIGGYELFFLRPDFKIKLPLKKTDWLIVLGGLLLVVTLLFMAQDFLGSLVAGYRGRDFTLGERLLTETRVVVFYLTILLFPALSRLNLLHIFPVSTGLFSPLETFLAIICLAVILYFIFRLYNNNRLVAFALFWFFSNLLIESTIIPLELVFEHRIYLPSVFIFIALTAVLYRFLSQRVHLLRMGLTAFMIALAVLTWQRNETWQNAINLWSDVSRKSPDRVRIYNNLAAAYADKNEFTKAIYFYQKALVIKPNRYVMPIVLRNLGFALSVKGRYDEAIKHLLRSIELDPFSSKAHLNLGIVYKEKGDMARANYHYSQARNIQANLSR